MSEQSSDAVNLDLNLVPDPEQQLGLISSEPTSSNDWVEPFNRIRDTMRLRAPQRSRWRQAQIPHEIQNISVELNEVMIDTGGGGTLQVNHGSGSTLQVNSDSGSTLQAGEGSLGSEERITEVPKICEHNNGLLEEASEKKDSDEKNSDSDGSFFDCNICFDLAKEPVVTCCGHLFCWPCLYQWLDHSDAKECPVCKGEVTMKNLIPIYGRGNDVREGGEDSTLKIPHRPHARRVESLRQTVQRAAFRFPVEELIRHLSTRVDAPRDMMPHAHNDGTPEVSERNDSLLNRFLTSRGLRREENPVPAPDEAVDLTQVETSIETGDTQRLHSLLFRRSQSNRAAAEVETYVRSRASGRNQELTLPVDDRDSFSSIAAVINSESQTIDTAAEIDSMVSHSTSSSRRRTDAPRAPDIDRGGPRPRRRRRLN